MAEPKALVAQLRQRLAALKGEEESLLAEIEGERELYRMIEFGTEVAFPWHASSTPPPPPSPSPSAE